MNKINIAVIAIGYQCPNLEKVLSPWVSIKNGAVDSDGNLISPPSEIANIDICCVSSLFKERYEMGEVYRNEDNCKFLNSYKRNKYIDEFLEIKYPILDFESRNFALDFFKANGKEYDFIWQLDIFDEFYSIDDINRVINYISREDNVKYCDFFKINFKNFFGEEKDGTYLLDFSPVRIINLKRNDGANRFYWDNDIEFNNKKRTPNCLGRIIPTSICNPVHLSWVGSKDFLIKKINYQHKAIGNCSFKWNYVNDKLEFDNEYYNRFNIPFPEIFNY